MRNYSSRKRVRVIGSAGFLGARLCERLIAEGEDVLGADNFFTGTRDNIAHLLASPGFAFPEGAAGRPALLAIGA